MFRKPSLSFLHLAFAFILCNYARAVTYVDNGTSNPYTLNAGDSLFIASGTYTGNIGGFAAGAKITVSDLAIFQPTGMNFPNVRGTMYVYGSFIMNNANFRTNTGFTIYNYGTVQINNQTTMSGQDQYWFNSFGANMYFVGDVIMNGSLGDDNNILTNYSNIECSGNFQMNSGSRLINNKEFSAVGDFLLNGGTYDNYGQFDITGNIRLNNGASIIRNHCRMMASGGITNTSGKFYNYSYVWARNDLGLGNINLSDTIFNIPVNGNTPMIHGKNLSQTNGSGIVGPALMYFYGTTSITSGASTGVAGLTTDTIKFYDVTRSNPATIYDVQSSTVHPNTIYNAWGAPDSTREYTVGCSLEILLEVPLGINWDYFKADLIGNVPTLSWSATYNPGTIFQIERSYNGSSFFIIGEKPFIANQDEYEFQDREISLQNSIVYYRIKAVEPNGNAKYTQVKMLRLGKTHSILVFPNPFAASFNVGYHSEEQTQIVIRIYNQNGQQLLIKKVTVLKGQNSIVINEAGQLKRGFYIISFSNGEKIISTHKLIKQ